MKGKKIILVGISGSGKSTFAEKFIKENPEFVRINRDSFREAFIPNHNTMWYEKDFKDQRSKLEHYITHMTSILTDVNDYVINDNTNLDFKRLKYAYYNTFNKEVEIWVLKDSYDINLCIGRDQQRDRIVGENIIKKQHKAFLSLIKELSLLENINIKEV